MSQDAAYKTLLSGRASVLIDNATSLGLVLAALGAAGGLCAFFIKKYVSASVDSHFSRRIGIELEQVRHEFSLDLERHKNSLSQSNAEQTRQADRVARLSAHTEDINRLHYEAFNLHYGDVASAIVAFALVKQTYDEKGRLYQEKIKLVNKIQEAQREVSKYSHYLSGDISNEISRLYGDMIDCVCSDTTQEQVDKVVDDHSKIFARLKIQVMAPLQDSLSKL